MNVVTRLIPRMEPKDPSMESCVESLSLLLTNEDPQIAEPAMKCFVALADRFIRRGKDPAPIVGKGLVEELMKRLSMIGKPLPSAQAGGATPEKPSSHSVNTIVNLLSTLCRGSPTITHVSAFYFFSSILSPSSKLSLSFAPFVSFLVCFVFPSLSSVLLPSLHPCLSICLSHFPSLPSLLPSPILFRFPPSHSSVPLLSTSLPPLLALFHSSVPLPPLLFFPSSVSLPSQVPPFHHFICLTLYQIPSSVTVAV